VGSKSEGHDRSRALVGLRDAGLVGGPLDLGEVDAFFDHLVEGGELAEVLDYVD